MAHKHPEQGVGEHTLGAVEGMCVIALLEMDELPDDLLPELDGNPLKLRYLEWLLTAEAEREPATKIAFAATLGVDRRTLQNWSGRDAFQAVWRREAAKVAGGVERTTQVLDMLFADATDMNNKPSERTSAGKEFIKVTQAISPQDVARQENPLAKMTLEELEAEYASVLQRELSSRQGAV